MILLRTGRLAEAQRCFEHVIHSPAFQRGEDRLASWRHSDDRAMARALLARALWLRGFPEGAHREAEASLGEVWGSEHQLTMCLGVRGSTSLGYANIFSGLREKVRSRPRRRKHIGSTVARRCSVGGKVSCSLTRRPPAPRGLAPHGDMYPFKTRFGNAPQF